MTKKPLPTLMEIRAAHEWKRDYERYLPLSRYLFRPVGFLLTWVSIQIGLASETISWLSGVVGLVACLCLLSTQELLLPFGIGFLLFFNLLDCVDGSMARVLKTENPYGKFLDSLMGFIDMAFWAVIGVIAYNHPQLLFFSDPLGYGSIFWLVAGGLTSYFFILLGYVENIFDHSIRDEWNNMKKKIRDASNISNNKLEEDLYKANLTFTPLSIMRRINHNLRVRETHYFFLILAYLGSMVDLFLFSFLLFYAFSTLFLILVYSIRGRKLRSFQSKQ
jgi:hypothetical protein